MVIDIMRNGSLSTTVKQKQSTASEINVHGIAALYNGEKNQYRAQTQGSWESNKEYFGAKSGKYKPCSTGKNSYCPQV